jgi:hypothetical protein
LSRRAASVSAPAWLRAVDTLSLDHGGSRDFAFHLAWLGASC